MYVELPYMNAIFAEIMVSSFTYWVKTIYLNLCRSFYHCLAFTPNVNDFVLQEKHWFYQLLPSMNSKNMEVRARGWGCRISLSGCNCDLKRIQSAAPAYHQWRSHELDVTGSRVFKGASSCSGPFSIWWNRPYLTFCARLIPHTVSVWSGHLVRDPVNAFVWSILNISLRCDFQIFGTIVLY